MFPRFFKSEKSSDGSKKKDKEISLILETPSQEPFIAKVAKSTLLKYSPVFKTMAEKGGLKSREIKLKGITSIGLQKALEYITTESVFFLSYFEVIETLKVAYLYQVTALNDVCTNFLIGVIDRENVCDIYEFASSYFYHQVEYHCLKFIDRYTEDVLKSPSFMTLKQATVEEIIKRECLNVQTELVLFRAVLTWGLNDCLRRGVDSEEVLKSVKPLMRHVRFAAMSEQELSDREVSKFHKLLPEEDSANNRTSTLRTESVASIRSTDSSSNLQQSREHVENYAYDLDILGPDAHSVRKGETFCLRVEVLKGRMFLMGMVLAFERFVSSKGDCCLFVALSATNVKTAEQVCARRAFMISDEEAVMKFPNPLVVKESESVEIAMNVKRAINVCSVLIKSDNQIVVPDRKDVAMKISPSSTSGGTERSMFKSILYFY